MHRNCYWSSGISVGDAPSSPSINRTVVRMSNCSFNSCNWLSHLWRSVSLKASVRPFSSRFAAIRCNESQMVLFVRANDSLDQLRLPEMNASEERVWPIVGFFRRISSQCIMFDSECIHLLTQFLSMFGMMFQTKLLLTSIADHLSRAFWTFHTRSLCRCGCCHLRRTPQSSEQPII